MDYVLYFLLLFVCAIYIFASLGVITYYLQLCGYSVAKTIRTCISKLDLCVVLIYLSPCAISIITNYFLIGSRVIWIFVLAEIMALFALIMVINYKPATRKVKLKITKRYLRIYLSSLIILVLLTAYACYYTIFNYKYLFGLVYLLPMIAMLTVAVVCVLFYPIEKIIALYHINTASKILKNHGGLINIAITGSYGKTSTKFILKTILSEKYKVLATPNSYNTPMGISKTIKEMLSDDTDIFVMEFGANKMGDIKYLCDKYRPNIGIITAIGKAHINTFKNIDNIIATKGSLVQNLYGRQPYAVFNADNKYVQVCYKKSNVDCILCGINNGQLRAVNIKTSSKGTSFDVIKEGKEYVSVKTKLIGLGNIQNILFAIAVAIRLKLSKQQIINGISKLQPISARLEVIPHSSGSIIINDGYNSNPVSARMAVDTLQLFDKKNKIVLTPGMVELGKIQYQENYDFGKYMATRVSKVYIANNENLLAIKNGLIAGGFDTSNIIINANFSNTLKTLTKDDILLIENDLPDNYS